MMLRGLCIALLTMVLGAQERNVEQEVKAAYLYNFAKFIEWPAEAFSDSSTPFTFCLTGDGFRGTLERILQGETLNGRPLTIKYVDGGQSIRSCHILFISGSGAGRSRQIIAAARNAPVLTVGESSGFIGSGGIVRFVRSRNRLRFEINPEAAERASLRISSRLLRLADVVAGGGVQ